MKKSHYALLALTTTAVIWGVALPLMKVNLETIPPFSLGFVRFFIATFLALVFIKSPSVSFKDFLHIGFFSFFGITVHIGLLLTGLVRSTSIDATFLLALSPVITSVLATMTIQERINIPHRIGIALTFFGTFLYLSYPFLVGKEHLSVNLLGDFLILLAVLSGSIYVIGSKKLFEIYPASSISKVSFTVGAITFLPLSLFEFAKDPTWVNNITGFNFISILFLGVFASFIAYTLLEWGLTSVSVHINETLSYISVGVSIFLANVFLGEKLNPTFAISIIIVVLGLYLVTRYKPQSHHHFQHRIHKV